MGMGRTMREDILEDFHSRLDLIPVNQLESEEEYNKRVNNVNNNKMKTSKVKNVQANGTWEKDGTTFYKFEYEMEDGQIVNAMHKTQEPKFKVGETAEYTITNAQYNNGKLSKPQEQGSYNDPKKQTSIIAQSCIKAACDAYSGLNKDADDIIKAAEKFFHWVNSK